MISQNAMFRSKIEPIRSQNWFKHDKNDKSGLICPKMALKRPKSGFEKIVKIVYNDQK